MAPQIHETFNDNGQQVEKYYDAKKTDIFALGVVFFCLVFGTLPFEYATSSNRIYKIIKDKGVPIAIELRDEPWGDRHFAIVDPNGIGIDIVTYTAPEEQ